MKKQLLLFLLALWSLTASLMASAGQGNNRDQKLRIGTKEEVIEAAKNNKEPLYLKEVMDELTKKLQPFALEQGIGDSPKTKLAWLISMRVIVCLIRDIAEKAAEEVTLKTPSEEASKAVARRSQEIGWQSDWNESVAAAANLLYKGAVAATDESSLNIAAIAAFIHTDLLAKPSVVQFYLASLRDKKSAVFYVPKELIVLILQAAMNIKPAQLSYNPDPL